MPLLGLVPGTGITPSPSTTAKTTTRGKIPRNLTLNDSAHYSLSQSAATSDPNYVPPAGSSHIKLQTKRERRNSRNSNASSVALDDTALAAQVNSMLSFNESSTSFGSSSHHRRMVPKRQDSRLSMNSAKYFPPTLPLSAEGAIQEDRRFLPESMDDIFSPKKSTRIKNKSTPVVETQNNNNTKEKPKRNKSVKTKASEDNSNINI